MSTHRFLTIRLLSVLVFTLILIPELNANWNPLIRNYSREQFGSGSQTWFVAPRDENWCYFANRNGLLQLHDNEWSLNPLRNKMETRTVKMSNSGLRLYVGGINEFGYFEANLKGEMEYNCLSDSLDDGSYLGNIWNIHEIDNIVYFCADGLIIKYFNGKFDVMHSSAKIECSSIINGTLYLGTDNGIFMLTGNRLLPCPGSQRISGKRIRGLIQYSEGLLIVTAHEGIFYCDCQTTRPFRTDADRFMIENEVFCVAEDEGLIAIGTIHKGIVLLDLNSPVIRYFNETNGLQNNTVLSIAFDHKDNLWAGLDNGIDYIMLNSPVSNLYNFPNFHGAGYTALLEGNTLYLGTNRGLYQTSYPIEMKDEPVSISQIPNSSGQVWKLEHIGDDIFCLHDRGLFLLKGQHLEKIDNISGAWSILPLINNPYKAIVGTYSELFVIEKVDSKWKVTGKINGIYDAVYNIEEESPGVFWMHNSTKGAARICIDFDQMQLTGIKYYSQKEGLPDNIGIFVNKIAGKIFFTTNEGVYTYNHDTDKMIPDVKMNQLLGGKSCFTRLREYRNRIIALKRDEICVTNSLDFNLGSQLQRISLDNKYVEPIKTLEALIPVSDSVVILPNDFGFALIKIGQTSTYTCSKESSVIKRIFVTSPKDSLIYSCNYRNSKYEPVLSYMMSGLRIEMGAGEGCPSFQYKIDDNEWSDYTSSSTKEITSLKEGRHTFRVRRMNENGITEDKFRFTILAPWYRTPIAYIVYILIFLILVRAIYVWDDLRVKRQKSQVMKEKEEEFYRRELEYEKENRRKEQQIISLEKEKLEHELHHKSQEMANLMINFARKNETLLNIKDELHKITSVLKGENGKEVRQMMLIVNNKIDENIQSDDLLKKIEEQFDLIHNNFMKRLSEKHPDLSQNERMMCAYLKMELSSKEIAPLLNISVRGVETIRYRLRKKFDLERESSINEYLNCGI